MNDTIRVRFAPSPTGPLHIGGVRTALFNYLFAKQQGGSFILRIEDTDQKRYVEGAESYISEALNWCGIPFDEGPGKENGFGPYRQSERKHLYEKYAQELLKKGRAYYAFDSSEALDNERRGHEAKGKTFIYNWHNRTKGRLVNSLVLSEEETRMRINRGDNYVIRFLSPEGQTLNLNDIVRGEIKIDSNTLDDKILFKSDGMPTYHLANVVDDHLMQISHVIRGEEWLPSLALHQLLYDALGWRAPQFAHLPLILKPSGKGKLSKRDGEKLGFPVFPLEWVGHDSEIKSSGYREKGYFPEAIVNFLAFLGWNPGTEQELFNLEELIEAFDLKKVNKSGARFDPEKIKWFNQHYMQSTDNKKLTEHLIKERKDLYKIDPQYIEMVVALIKERAVFPSDLWHLSHYFFKPPLSYDEKGLKKSWKENSKDLMVALMEVIENSDDSSAETLQSKIKEWITVNEIGFGKIMMPLRLALVGALEGADVFKIIFMIGREETNRRIKTLIESQQKH
jgi:glutamyl-tRNA synthetase